MANKKAEAPATPEVVEPKAWADGIPVYCAHDAIVKTSDLRPNPKNPNTHPPEQVKKLGGVIRGNGWRAPITVSLLSGMIVKGHGRQLAALLEELKEVPVDYQNYDTEAAEMADLWADNYIAELAETDTKLAADLLAGIQLAGAPLELAGSSQEEYDTLVNALSGEDDEEDPDEEYDEEEEDDEPAPPAEPVTQRGDIWILGRHRVMCGDSGSEKDKALLLDGNMPQILLTDPPYCSGGYQEAGKGVGSIGTDRKDGMPSIVNDTLSTRGYQTLMRHVLDNIPALVAYIFTDWRMWINLFDVTEAAGFGVRNMIVWNKKTPGMGMGWRTQHELVMYGQRTKAKWDNHKGYGNVIEISRSGNALHPTQKPIELIEILLDNTAWLSGVFDPFAGSGTTLIAAERKDQPSYCMELTPGYTDVIVERYIRETGDTNIRCIRNGRELSAAEIAPILDRADEGGGEE